eukprot:2180620-Prymnesium_polylepis.1
MLRGCGPDDDEDLTIDQWLALDDGNSAMEEESTSSDDPDSDSDDESPSESDDSAPCGSDDTAYDAVRVCAVRRRGKLQALVEWSGTDSTGAPWAR